VKILLVTSCSILFLWNGCFYQFHTINSFSIFLNQKTKVSQESVSNSWKYKTPQLPIVCPWHTFLCESLQFLGQILSWVHNIILWNFTYVLKLAWQIKQLHVGFFVVWMKIWKSQTVVLRSIGKLLAYNYFLCCQKRSKVVFKCKKSTQTEECDKSLALCTSGKL